jgi:mannose-1-phosphate guanylyltransferase
LGEPTTLLQRALHRARQIAPVAQIVVTVREENRESWGPALWFIRPEHRIVSDSRTTAPLTTAAALLAIAADSATNVVTILPARCYVASEWILHAALNQLQLILPRIPEGVGTLGMVDIEDGIDEDYLVPFETRVGPGQAVLAMARRPAEWIARHLRQHGAMVASGILTGYAGVFAMHASRVWPGLAKALTKITRIAADGERRLCADGYRGMPQSVLRSLRWWPPIFPQRAIRVYRCGWRGLRTARAVARISASCPATIDSELESWTASQATRSSDFDHAASRANCRCVDHGWVD